MCGRTFSQSRKCLKCGDDLPWLVYAGEISFAKRRGMTVPQYKEWRENRVSEKMLVKKVAEARKEMASWFE